ncbi:MAG TPA: PAS domain S-box protein, partial [Candidatus Paceibacterota bacterium]|nr:PAS domain S-box protein [Candidatus Paceibacterota bacterium]
MKTKIHRFLTGTLRGRLILSVALVHAVMMTLFIVDLTKRQRAMLLERQVEETSALAQALATSAAGWIAADDVSGLQEIVDAQRRYPEILFVILVDEQGRVLAHTEKSRLGQYLLDLPREARLIAFSRTPALVDVTVPAMIGGRHVGWARVGIGRKATSDEMKAIVRNGVLYAVAAIAVGSVLAWAMGVRITRRLYLVQKTIDAVRAGDRMARSSVSGNDEPAVMAREFNSMLDMIVGKDIELRKKSEELDRYFTDALDLLCIADTEGFFRRLNPQWEKTLGYPVAELLGKRFIDFVHPDDRQATLDAIMTLAGQKEVRDFVNRYRHQNGGYRWIEWRSFPSENRIYAVARDITDRKNAEEALRKSTAEIQDLYDHAPCGYHSLDENGHFLRINDTALEWLGYRREELVGKKKFTELLTPEGVKTFEANFPRFMALGSVHDLEFSLIRKNGTILPTLVSATAITDADGRFVRSRSVVLDITERKRAEQERQSYLRFVESLDLVNRAIQSTNDTDQMIRDVLDVLFPAFNCDRCFLVFPCDPGAPSWHCVMERNRPEFPGAYERKLEVPMTPENAASFRVLLESEGPVTFGPGLDMPLSAELRHEFQIQSMMAMAVYPKGEKPYAMGFHQCGGPRVWAVEEKKLLQEIGFRLADGLSRVLAYRHLEASEVKYRRIVD